MISKSKNNKIVTYRKEKKLLFLIFYKQDMYSISCIRIGFGRLEIRDRSSTASGRNHTQKQGDTPKRKQNHRLSLLDTGRHELWRSVRHTVRDSHITGSRAVSGVWL